MDTRAGAAGALLLDGSSALRPGDSDLITDDSYRTIADPALATRSFIGIFAGRFFPDLTFETDDVIQGRITGITQDITSIPEPAAAWLMAAGLIALLATTCRRRWARPTFAVMAPASLKPKTVPKSRPTRAPRTRAAGPWGGHGRRPSAPHAGTPGNGRPGRPAPRRAARIPEFQVSSCQVAARTAPRTRATDADTPGDTRHSRARPRPPR